LTEIVASAPYVRPEVLMPLFPMPLIPFEHYMAVDDSPAYPMAFFLRLGFRGRLDHGRWASALRAALELHPLLAAHVRGSRHSRLCWVAAADALPTIRVSPHATYNDLPIDLRCRTGLQMWMAEQESGTEVLCQFHHSCCDAIGALHFLQTVLTAYDQPRTSLSQLLADFQGPEFLPGRANMGMSENKARNRLKNLPVDAARLLRFFRHAPTPLAFSRATTAGRQPQAGPGFRSCRLSTTASAALRDGARAQQATVNDVLLRDLFLTLDRWNRRRAPAHAQNHLRIAVPVNTRGPGERLMSAFNGVSMVFIDRSSQDLGGEGALLQGIRQETVDIKERRMQRIFLGALRALCCYPPSLALILNMSRCMATAVLSNLGVLFGQSTLSQSDGRLLAGDVILDRLEFFPPIRPLTLASFGVFTYANQLHICLHFDARRLAAQECEELLQMFVDRVGATIH